MEYKDLFLYEISAKSIHQPHFKTCMHNHTPTMIFQKLSVIAYLKRTIEKLMVNHSHLFQLPVQQGNANPILMLLEAPLYKPSSIFCCRCKTQHLSVKYSCTSDCMLRSQLFYPGAYLHLKFIYTTL